MSSLSIFRSLIPSWGFFEDHGPCPVLEWRVGPDAQRLGPWQSALDPLRRRPHHLFFNPTGNARLLVVSALDRLVSESQDYLDNFDDFVLTSSYRIVTEIIRVSIAAHGVRQPVFQFKVTTLTGGDRGPTRIDALVSRVHEVIP